MPPGFCTVTAAAAAAAVAGGAREQGPAVVIPHGRGHVCASLVLLALFALYGCVRIHRAVRGARAGADGSVALVVRCQVLGLGLGQVHALPLPPLAAAHHML